MKKLLFISLVSFGCSLTAVSQEKNHEGHNHEGHNHEVTTPVKSKKKPKKQAISFTTLTIERMNIPFGSDETFSFPFKNTGKESIIISNVQTSCGCTKAKQPEEPIARNKKSEIAVKYDTKRVGDFTKTITVTSNVAEPIILTIKGSVLPEKK